MSNKREIVIDLLARDKSKPATDSFAKGLKGAGDAADKAGRDTEKFGKSTVVAGHHVDQLGDEIKKVEQDLVLLAGAFATAGDKAERLDIAKGIRKSRAELRQLKNVKDLLPEPEPMARSFMQNLGAGIARQGASLSGALGGSVGPTIGGAIGVAAAPVLLGTLSTAIPLAAGAAGLGAGIALAMRKDPGLQSGAKKIGADFMTAMSDSAVKNFGGPLKQSLTIVDDLADRSAKKFDTAFKSLSGNVVPLVSDLAQAGDRVVDMFVNLSAKSGPALDAIGDSVRLITDGVGDMLEIMADDSSGAADNLTLIAGATADVLRWTGLLLDTLNKISNNAWVTGPLLPFLRDHYKEVADESDNTATKTGELADAMTNAEKAARGQLDAMDELATELKAQTDPVFGLMDAQERLKKAQDDVNESTRKNGADSAETQKALRNLAKAALDVQSNAGKLGQTFDGTMTPALRAALRAAGATAGEVDALEKQFNQARRAGNSFAKTYRAKIVTEYINKYTSVTSNSALNAYESTLRSIQKRALGGPIQKDTPYWVGEQGPELVIPNHDGKVLTSQESKARARTGGPGTSVQVQPQTMRLELAGEREIVAFIRRLIRTENLLQG